MKHTPGKWIAGGLTVRSDNGIICICPTPQAGGTFDCSQNTTLIAAAPEMYEALKSINEWLLDCGEPIERRDLWNTEFLKAHDLAAAAIAKAEGK